MKLQNLTSTQGFILAFTIGFVVRLIPELLSFPYPIGWDTIYYAYRISDGTLFGYWNNIFSTWLPYWIMIFLGNLSQLDPFLLLKILAPLLYGGTSAGIFFVAWKKLDWCVTKSLLASAFFAFQLAALAVSWHFYRNVFGVMLLLFTIPFIKSDIGWRGAAGLSVLGLLVILGHEFAAVSFFFMVFGLLVLSLVKRENIPYRLFVALIPALIVFLISNLGIFRSYSGLERSILMLGDSVSANSAGLFFLTDYLQVFTPNQFYVDYFELFSHVFSLFLLLYVVLLPLIAFGRFKDRVFDSWLVILLAGAFGCLIVPFSALLLWHRWMLMLVYPFTFLAVNGLWKLLKTKEGVSISRFFGEFKFARKFGIGLTLLTVVVGCLFMSWPLIDGRYGIIGVESTFSYIPSTMQSSSVPLQDTKGTIAAFEWLNDNMTDNSSLLAHDVFEFWTLLYLENDHTAIVFDHDLEEALDFSSKNGFTSSYLVWWNEDIGWYNFDIPQGCSRVQDFGRISIYEFANA